MAAILFILGLLMIFLVKIWLIRTLCDKNSIYEKVIKIKKNKMHRMKVRILNLQKIVNTVFYFFVILRILNMDSTNFNQHFNSFQFLITKIPLRNAFFISPQFFSRTQIVRIRNRSMTWLMPFRLIFFAFDLFSLNINATINERLNTVSIGSPRRSK